MTTGARRSFEQAMVVLAIAATIFVNTLANSAGLFGARTGEIANRFDVYFTPAGWVFSIWGVIYAGLIAFAIWQVRPAHRNDAGLAAIRWPVILTCVANVGWLVSWHAGAYIASLIIMLLLYGLLAVIYRSLRQSGFRRGGAFLSVDAVFRVYIGWITVATLANAAVVFDVQGWRPAGVGAEAFAIGLIAVLVAAVVAVAWRLRDPWWLAVLLWAAIGIVLKPGQSLAVQACAGAAAIGAAAAILAVLYATRGAAKRPDGG